MASTDLNSHLPDQPSWHCFVCKADWPCDPAREALRGEYAETPVMLAIWMGAQLGLAASEIPVRVTPAELYERFIAWTRPAPLDHTS